MHRPLLWLLASFVSLGPALVQATGPALAITTAPARLPVPTPTPTPTPISAAGGVLQKVLPPAPTALHQTSDVTECQAHQGNFACASLQGGSPVTILVWTGPGDPTGYRIYRTDVSPKVLVLSLTQPFDGVIPSAALLTSVAPGSCFAVSALRGALESALGTPACLGAGGPKTTNTVATIAMSARAGGQVGGGCATNVLPQPGAFSGTDPAAQLIQVGYAHTEESGILCSQWHDYYWRGGLSFAVNVAGETIRKATLSITINTSVLTSSTDHSTNCATVVAAGKSQWWQFQDPPDVGSPQLSSAVQGNGATYTIDVTPIVQAWAKGQQNDGLVLTGANENVTQESADECLSTIVSAGPGAPILSITSM